MPSVTIDQGKCIKCLTCVKTCPMGVYAEAEGGVEVVKMEDCIACMGCVAACPVEAITVVE